MITYKGRKQHINVFLFDKDLTNISILCLQIQKEIIQFYIQTKGGGDTFDQMFVKYVRWENLKIAPLCYGMLRT